MTKKDLIYIPLLIAGVSCIVVAVLSAIHKSNKSTYGLDAEDFDSEPDFDENFEYDGVGI